MLRLPSTPEFEKRLSEEAAKRGLQAGEYALRLIEGLLKPENVGDAAEQARLAAIDALLGAAVNSSFSSAELRRERNSEKDAEEKRHVRRFKKERKP